MERKYCEVLEDDFKNCKKPSYEEHFAFFWHLAETARAKSPEWPQNAYKHFSQTNIILQ